MTDDLRQRTVIVATPRAAFINLWRQHEATMGDPLIYWLVIEFLTPIVEWIDDITPDAVLDIPRKDQILHQFASDDTIALRTPIIFATTADAVRFKLSWSHAYELETPR